MKNIFSLQIILNFGFSYFFKHYFCKNFGPSLYDETNEGLIRSMIHLGMDVNSQNANGESPLHYACLSGNLSIVKLLLKCGARVNIRTEKGNFIYWLLLVTKVI